ncbi:MAG: tetratricopeptide repeat protein [Kiritimatiellae bacterium]|nr:tetratricopeptide repeat protein [Kiritimatiellia bacterium]
MHWLTMVGVLLIAVGTVCTYWGVELRYRGRGAEGASANAEPTQQDGGGGLREEHRQLLTQTKMIQEENARLRADNTTLALKHKRTEEDVEVYKFRAHELQQTLERLEKKAPNAASATATVWPVSEKTPGPSVGGKPVEPSRAETMEEPDEGESEMDVISRLQSLLAGRDYAALEEAASEQVRRNPNWMTPYVYQGVAARHLGRRQKALQSFVYVVENGAGDPAWSQAERALKLMTSGIQDLAEKNDWEKLAQSCEKYIVQEPDWSLPYYFAGLAYTHIGNKQKAMEYLTHFIESSPDDPETPRAERALRLLKTNILELQRQADYMALIVTCEREIAGDPDWMTPYYLLGLAYAKLGNAARARENLELFVRRAADDPDYENAQKLLESLSP